MIYSDVLLCTHPAERVMAVLVILIIARLVVAFVAIPALIRVLAVKPSISKRLAIQFLFCSIIAAGICLALRDVRVVPVIALIGSLNAVAAYLQWKSTRLSVSKTAVFGFNDVVTIILGATLLKEYQDVSPAYMLGVVFLGTALYLLYKGSKISRVQAVYIVGFSFIWGVTTFLMKALPVPVHQFLLSWYLGSTAGAAAIALALARTEKEILGLRDYIATAVLSIFVLASVGLQLMAYRLGSLIVIQPIYIIGSTFLPLLVGAFIFHERAATKQERTAMLLALAACLLIAISKTTQ